MALFSGGLAKNWKERLSSVLKKEITFSKPLDTTELEALLLEADLPYTQVEKILADSKVTKAANHNDAILAIKSHIMAWAAGTEHPLPYIPEPACVVLLGVNGAGKTTTAGRLAHYWKSQGRNVLIAACDTFRAGAVDQIQLWAHRAGVECISQGMGADSAAVAFDAWSRAKQERATLLVDTAGRLHNKGPLMEQLAKLGRVLKKDESGAPHQTWLVIDGTTGQNTLIQAKEFNEVMPINGLIVTKLDGTAKGGASLAAALDLRVPIRFVGTGEKLENLEVYSLEKYVNALLGLQN